jgi:integrase
LMRSPANKLDSPRTTQVAKDVVTAEQFRAVVAEPKLPHNPMVRVAVACAFRPTELLALRWRDFGRGCKNVRDSTDGLSW